MPTNDKRQRECITLNCKGLKTCLNLTLVDKCCGCACKNLPCNVCNKRERNLCTSDMSWCVSTIGTDEMGEEL